jgi:hypothetical protein
MHLHRVERRAVDCESERRSGKHRSGTGSTPGSASRPESAPWRQNSGAVVRSGGIRPAGAVHVGNAPHNGVIGLGFASLDFSLAETWTLPSRAILEFRWETFNLLNRANFDPANRIFGSPNFGRIFSAKNPREMQFGLRLAF